MIVFDKYNPWLAPLAGYSDLAMRLLCRQYGAKVCVTEMVSAKGIVYGGKNTRNLLKTSPDDKPLIVQLFGSEPHFLADALARIQDMGFEYFDINMGCSVPKVVKTGAGAAMLKSIDNLFACAEAVIKQSKQKTGFKIRLGYDMHKAVWQEIVPTLCQMDALYIVLHPRYARQLFTGKADWNALTELKELSTIPVIASGDLLSSEDALECIAQTKVDSVMFARGALSNPAIFQEYLARLNNEEVPKRDIEKERERQREREKRIEAGADQKLVFYCAEKLEISSVSVVVQIYQHLKPLNVQSRAVLAYVRKIHSRAKA